MSIPVPGSGSTESVPTWVSPAQQDAARAASIESVLPQVDGVASVFPPAGAELAGLAPEGVRVNDERVEVHIIAEYGRPLQATADDLDLAVRPLLDGRDLQIVVDDILLPGESLPELEPEPELGNHLEFEPAATVESDPAVEVQPAQKRSGATDPGPVRTAARTEAADSGAGEDLGPDADADPSSVTDAQPQPGVTVTVAPEVTAEVTITTDQHGAVQVDVPATPPDDRRDPGDERAAGV